jgi:hypothetical protein
VREGDDAVEIPASGSSMSLPYDETLRIETIGFSAIFLWFAEKRLVSDEKRRVRRIGSSLD